MNENVHFSNVTLDLAIDFMRKIIERPLSRVFDKGNSRNSLRYILEKLEEDNYNTIGCWKKDIDDLLNKCENDEKQKLIKEYLGKKIKKEYDFILKIANSQFETVIKDVNNKIIMVVEQNSGDNFSFTNFSGV